MIHDDYAQVAQKLLDAIPEGLRDKRNPALLGGMTPREAAGHVRQSGCAACRYDLRDIAEGAA